MSFRTPSSPHLRQSNGHGRTFQPMPRPKQTRSNSTGEALREDLGRVPFEPTGVIRGNSPMHWLVRFLLLTVAFQAILPRAAAFPLPSGNDCTPYLENAENGRLTVSGFGTLWGVMSAFNALPGVGNNTMTYQGNPITSTTFVSESASSPLRQICAEPPGLEVEYIKASAEGVMLDTLGNKGVNRTAFDPLIYAGNSAGALAQLKADLGIVDITPSPTSLPSGSPTSLPSGSPTSLPTGSPTGSPTGFPTGSPTPSPTNSTQLVNGTVVTLEETVQTVSSILGVLRDGFLGQKGGGLLSALDPKQVSAMNEFFTEAQSVLDGSSSSDGSGRRRLSDGDQLARLHELAQQISEQSPGLFEKISSAQEKSDTVLLSAFSVLIAGLVGAGTYYVKHHGTFLDEVKHQSVKSIKDTVTTSNTELYSAITDFIQSGTTGRLLDWLKTNRVSSDSAIKITESITQTADNVLNKKIRSWSVIGAPTIAEERAARALTMCLLVAATGGHIDLSDNPATRPVPTAANTDVEAQKKEEKSNSFAVVIDASTRVTTRLRSHGTRIDEAVQEAKAWAPPQPDTEAVSSPGRHLVRVPSHFASPSSVEEPREVFESKSDDEVSIDDVRLSFNASSPLRVIVGGPTVEQSESDSSLNRFPTSLVNPGQNPEISSETVRGWLRFEVDGSTYSVDPTLVQDALNSFMQSQRGQSGWPREAFQSVCTGFMPYSSPNTDTFSPALVGTRLALYRSLGSFLPSSSGQISVWNSFPPEVPPAQRSHTSNDRRPSTELVLRENGDDFSII